MRRYLPDLPHRPWRAVALGLGVAALLAGCNSNQSSTPTPPSMPGGMPSNLPSPPSVPGSTPAGRPGATPSSPSMPSPSMPSPSSPPSGDQTGDSGSPPPPTGSSGGAGTPSSYEDLPGGAPPPPAPGSTAGGADGSGEPAGEPGWEQGLPGAGDEDGWETSNQLPGEGTAQIPPMPSERDRPPGSSADSASADGALDEALEDFDGEILSERAVIRTRSNETAGTTGAESLPGGGGGSGEADGAVDGGGTAASIPAMPGGPMGGTPSNRGRGVPVPPGASGNVPEDIPDARDDDIIARQLREAAMQETDPALKEKLWDEYRRYKGI